MVEQRRIDGWKCPGCNKFHSNYNDAIYCIKKCTAGLEEEPYESSIFSYVCEACKKSYANERHARDCEANHMKKKDYFQQAREDKESKERLLRAGNDKFQSKLL